MTTIPPQSASPSGSRAAAVEKLLLRIPEAAELAGVGRTTAYALVASGEWPSVTIGRAVRVPLAGLRAWVEARTKASADVGCGSQGA